ncbi:MAG TPA: hypothetical protein VFP72_13470 [Kineosporiaceae bacterium]|nr:hypothetical protein [Kineosporiaceae bacterium]
MTGLALDLSVPERLHLRDLAERGQNSWYGGQSADVLAQLAEAGLATVDEHPHAQPGPDGLTVGAVRYRAALTPRGQAAAQSLHGLHVAQAPDGALLLAGVLAMSGIRHVGDPARPSVGGVDVLLAVYRHLGESVQGFVTAALCPAGTDAGVTLMLDGKARVDFGYPGLEEAGDPPALTVGGFDLLDLLAPSDGETVTLWVASAPVDVSQPVRGIRLAHPWRGHGPGARIVVDQRIAADLDRSGYVVRPAPKPEPREDPERALWRAWADAARNAAVAIVEEDRQYPPDPRPLDVTPAEDVLRHELVRLWADLEAALEQAAGGPWSMRAADVLSRIAMISQVVGPPAWSDVSTPFLRTGVLQAVLEGLGFPTVDPSVYQLHLDRWEQEQGRAVTRR